MRRGCLACLIVFAIVGGFLSVSRPAAADIPSVSMHLDNDALSKLGWQMACQTATFRQMTCFEMIDMLRALNVQHIELAPGQVLSPDRRSTYIDPSMPQNDIDALNTKLAVANMDVVSIGILRLTNNEADARRVFEFARKLKARTIIANPPPDALPMLDKMAGANQIKLAIINGASLSPARDQLGGRNRGDLRGPLDADSVTRVFTGNYPNIGICADLANWRRAGLKPLDTIQKFAGKIVEVRLADVNEQNIDVPLGRGTTDFSAVLAWLKTRNFKGVCAVGYYGTPGQGAQSDVGNNWVASVNAFSDVVTKLAGEGK